jgi:hypothetical protein
MKTVYGQVPCGVRASAFKNKKIENSFGPCVRTTIMSSKRVHMNIVDLDQVGSDREQSYSDDEFNEVMFDGDRCEDSDDQESIIYSDYEGEDIIYKETYADIIAKKLMEEHLAEMIRTPVVLRPSEMTVILPPRSLPSVEEMNAEWGKVVDQLIVEEYFAKLTKMGNVLKAGWDIRRSKAEEEKRATDMIKWRMDRVSKWRATRRNNEGISRLGPLRSFEDDEKLMKIWEENEKNREEDLKNEEYGLRMKKLYENANKLRAEREKKRMSSNRGMNNQTAEQKASNAKAKIEADKAMRAAANSERLKTKAKEHAEWLAENARVQALPKHSLITIDYIVEDEEVKQNEADEKEADEKEADEKEAEDEEVKQNEADEKEVMKNLLLQSIYIVEERERREEKEKVKKAEVDALEAEAEDLEVHFINTMTKSMGVQDTKHTLVKDDKKNIFQLGFVGLIAQKKAERCLTDAKFSKRSEAFSDLADKKKLDEVLTFTTLCKSVTSGKKCYHTNCRFAHSFEQLKARECRFGESCGFVRKTESGQYMNAKFGRTGKTCFCLHPGETQLGLSSRMGLKNTEKAVAVPVQVVTPVHVAVPVPVHVAEVEVKSDNKTWASIVYNSIDNAEKNKMYGKGLEMVSKNGYVDGSGLGKQSTGIVNPLSIYNIRHPRQTTGLGYYDKPGVCVTAKGFSWVKGSVLQPEKRVTESRWDVKPKFMVAVDELNQKLDNSLISDKHVVCEIVDKLEKEAVCVTAKGFSWVKGSVLQPEKRVMKSRWDVKPKFMVAVDELNKRLNDNLMIEAVVDRAKAKAVDINNRLDENKYWTRVRTRSAKPILKTISSEIVFRVPMKDAQLALLSAIRNGISNFRIEFSDNL